MSKKYKYLLAYGYADGSGNAYYYRPLKTVGQVKNAEAWLSRRNNCTCAISNITNLGK